MNRFPDLQTNLIFSETAPSETTGSEAQADAVVAVETIETTETTEQPVPLAPQVTGVLEPISGTQTMILALFGVLAFFMLVAITRFGRENDYGD